jgi:hypothetical protein
MQVAPFLHGTDAHSSISVLQSLPEDKVLHQQNRRGGSKVYFTEKF